MKGIMSRYILFAMLMVLALNSCQQYEIPEAFLSTNGSSSGTSPDPTPDPTPAPTKLEAVDLGLSVKWANMNYGATSVNDKGTEMYFGDGQGNGGFYEEKDGKSGNLSGTSYDVAHNKLGGKWRVPTREEWDELLKYTHMTDNSSTTSKVYTFTASSGKYITFYQGDWHHDIYWTSSYLYYSYGGNTRYYGWETGTSTIHYQNSPFTKGYIRPVCDY